MLDASGDIMAPTTHSSHTSLSALFQHGGAGSDSGTVVLLAAVLSALFLGLSVFSLFAYQKIRGAMDWKAPLKSLESYSWEVRIQDLTPVYFLAVWLLAINLIPFVISLVFYPIYYYRYTIAASVALYLLVGKGIANIN